LSGLQLKLPTAFSDATLPVLYADEVMSAGSLMLIDPTNPFVAWSPGLPADLGAIPNVAAATARVLLGVNSDAEVSLIWNQGSGFSGSAGLIERTARGGLHGIASQVNAVTQSGPSISGRNNLISYILDNSTHSYYMSTWQRATRLATKDSVDTLVAINGNGQQTNSYLFTLAGAFPAGNQYGERGVALGRVHSPLTGYLGNTFHAQGNDKWRSSGVDGSLPGDGTNTSVTGAFAGLQIPFGNAKSVNGIGADGTPTTTASVSVSTSSGNTNTIGSHVVYRVYLEDLTVSGRTFDEVEKIDHAAYDREVLGSAGRYFGDTFTDPSTLP